MISFYTSGALSLHCYKMHGLGNDYIYMLRDELPDDIDCVHLSRCVSDRHFGIGSDGLVVIGQSSEADFSMMIWNADGSQAQMCGNASRCVAVLVRALGLTDQRDMTLSTLCGIKYLHVNETEAGDMVTVNMGSPILQTAQIPINAPSVFNRLDTPCGKLDIVAVSMGNPHGVIFSDNYPTDKLVLGCGPVLERHRIWPQKANIEFAHVLDSENIEMRVWERGSGETMACGTGACACAVAAILTHRTSRKVNIHLPGGTLLIHWDKNTDCVLMSGPASFIAEITYLYYPKR